MKRLMLKRFAMMGMLLIAMGCAKKEPPEATVAIVEEPEVKAASNTKEKDKPNPKKTVAAKEKDKPNPKLTTTTIDAKEGSHFSFAKDAGGTALEKLLTPSKPDISERKQNTTPKPRLKNAITNPLLVSLPSGVAPFIRIPIAIAKPVKPSSLPEPVPMNLGGTPELPKRPDIVSGPLFREDRPDYIKPAPLPILARQVPNRAPLDDPSREYSALKMISTVLPLRINPAPFIKINLPDPFEYSKDAKPITTISEDPNKVLPNLPPPPRKGMEP